VRDAGPISAGGKDSIPGSELGFGLPEIGDAGAVVTGPAKMIDESVDALDGALLEDERIIGRPGRSRHAESQPHAGCRQPTPSHLLPSNHAASQWPTVSGRLLLWERLLLKRGA
jgi:hypothetical protein